MSNAHTDRLLAELRAAGVGPEAMRDHPRLSFADLGRAHELLERPDRAGTGEELAEILSRAFVLASNPEADPDFDAAQHSALALEAALLVIKAATDRWPAAMRRARHRTDGVS